MKIVKSLEQSGLVEQGISETIKHDAKEQKWGFISILLGTLADSILRNALTGGKVIGAEHFLMSPHPLTKFEI